MISSSSIVKALTEKRGGEPSLDKDLAPKLISFLKKNHLLGLLPGVVARLEKYYEKEKVRDTVFVTTSHHFSENIMKEIESRVGSLDGKRVERKIDPAIIGGFKVKSGYKIIDGSIKTNLKKLKESLLKTNG